MSADGSDYQWVPFGIEDEIESYKALDPDITPWLRTSLWQWIESAITYRSASGYRYLMTALARKSERILRVPLAANLENASTDAAFRHIEQTYSDLDDTKTWQLVDFLLAENPVEIAQLQLVLVECGSAWAVGERMGKVGIVKRLPEGVSTAAEEIFQTGDAGKRLAGAWLSAFGVNPDPEAAYSRAVKAVEDAAIPVVSPKNTGATLGTIIRDIKQNSNFKLPHLREHPEAQTHNVLLSMLQMLWTGQHDRHGGPSSVPVPNVTQDEAEAAVTLAVTLVGWFVTGKVQK